MSLITVVEDYFANGCGRCERFATLDCSTRRWLTGLTDLRRLCLDAGLSESAKWGHPCYMHASRNIALLGAFREDFRISFFEAALLKDPESVLERRGPNTQHPDMIRFTNNEQVEQLAGTISRYLTEAMGYAEAGLKAPKRQDEPELPDELVEALTSDAELADAFAALTPGRKRSYVIKLASAKKASTREARIARYRGKIIAGKGANER